MASITIKNLPEDVHGRLKEIARSGGRSLNQEIVQQLRAAVVSSPTVEEIEKQIESVRRHNEKMIADGYVPPSPEEIVRIIREGRERH